MRALAILIVLPLVLTTPALAQNAQSIQQQPTSPNSGAGIPGQPGGKSGPAVKPLTECPVFRGPKESPAEAGL